MNKLVNWIKNHQVAAVQSKRGETTQWLFFVFFIMIQLMDLTACSVNPKPSVIDQPSSNASLKKLDGESISTYELDAFIEQTMQKANVAGLSPFRQTVAIGQAIGVMWRRRPAAVLGMGGFVTGPGGVAAKLLGRPLLIHEQNAIAGMTNRLLSRIADAVLEAFPGTFAPKASVMHTGNPVRNVIAAVAEPKQRYAERSGPLRLFVVGGSLGAKALEETVPQAVALLAEPNRPVIRHQTGQKNFDAAQQAYDKAGVRANLSVKVATNQNREVARQVINPFVQISMLGFITPGTQS